MKQKNFRKNVTKRKVTDLTTMNLHYGRRKKMANDYNYNKMEEHTLRPKRAYDYLLENSEDEQYREEYGVLELPEAPPITTIPIISIRTEDIKSEWIYHWDPFWDHLALHENTPIIIELRKNTILAGQYQLYKAKMNNQRKIQATYLDYLPDITISDKFLKAQFKEKKLYQSFAYNLYASVAVEEDLVSFSDFCDKIYDNFINKDVHQLILNRIGILNYLIGAPNDGRD